jgi:hypothetical protein
MHFPTRWKFSYMKINHSGTNIAMTKQILNANQINAIFEQMGGIRVAEGMHGHRFLESGCT